MRDGKAFPSHTWWIVAEEPTEETNSERISQLVEESNAAIDQQSGNTRPARQASPNPTTHPDKPNVVTDISQLTGSWRG
jgi:hypothetical protein